MIKSRRDTGTKSPGISTTRDRLPKRRMNRHPMPPSSARRRHPRTSTRRATPRRSTRRRRQQRRKTGRRTRTSRSREASSQACRWGSFRSGASATNCSTPGKCCPMERRKPVSAWRSGRSSAVLPPWRGRGGWAARRCYDRDGRRRAGWCPGDGGVSGAGCRRGGERRGWDLGADDHRLGEFRPAGDVVQRKRGTSQES